MSYKLLTCEIQDVLAIVTLNRPDQRNALNTPLRDEIIKVMDELSNHDEIKVVVLTGAGSVFCAGFDLKEFAEGDMEKILNSSKEYHRRFYAFSKPIIAAINGPAMAGGMDLALMCDLRVSVEEAQFGQPQVKMGIPAAYHLIRTVLPEAVARDLCLTGRRMGAREALSVGLVNRVVPGGRLMEVTLALAREVAASAGSTAMKGVFVAAQPNIFE